MGPGFQSVPRDCRVCLSIIDLRQPVFSGKRGFGKFSIQGPPLTIEISLTPNFGSYRAVFYQNSPEHPVVPGLSPQTRLVDPYSQVPFFNFFGPGPQKIENRSFFQLKNDRNWHFLPIPPIFNKNGPFWTNSIGGFGAFGLEIPIFGLISGFGP